MVLFRVKQILDKKEETVKFKHLSFYLEKKEKEQQINFWESRMKGLQEQESLK